MGVRVRVGVGVGEGVGVRVGVRARVRVGVGVKKRMKCQNGGTNVGGTVVDKMKNRRILKRTEEVK